jgi:CheY-like chemotaxis protein
VCILQGKGTLPTTTVLRAIYFESHPYTYPYTYRSTLTPLNPQPCTLCPGYVCREAGDGQQALDVYKQMCADGTPPCAVLMDYEMPVINGPTATKHLRELGCDSYIVGVTGNVMEADVAVFIQVGADSVLVKPLRVEQFERMVRTLVQSLEWMFQLLTLTRIAHP